MNAEKLKTYNMSNMARFAIGAFFILVGAALIFNYNAYWFDSRGLNWLTLVIGIPMVAYGMYRLYKINSDLNA